MKWAGTRLEKYGKHLSRDQLALLHCWETIDPRRRYSWNSHFFYLIWGDQCFLGSWKFDSNKIRALKRSGKLLFTTGKPTSVELRMDTKSSTQHWISELTKAWTTWEGALQRWLEVIDPRHRVGRNLNFYFQEWMTSSGGQPFFYWLDVGDGKTAEHRECSREKLRHERNTYLELVSKSKVAESIMSLVLRSVSNTEKDINNNQREHGRADGFNQQASKSEAVESPASLIVRSESDPKKYINNNQREPDRADGFDQQASNSEAVESPASFVPRKQRSSTIIRVEDDINNNQREPDRADGFDQQASNSEAVQSPASLMHGRQGSSTTSRVVDDLNYNQREHDRADGFDQQASISEAVQSPAPLMHGRQGSLSWPSPSSTIFRVEAHINNNQPAHNGPDQPAHNGPADGLNRKEQDLWRRIFYAMTLLFEIATAVLDYLSSQQSQPRYALSGMILSITVMAISLIQLAYTAGKEGVCWQWNGWIPRFYHPAPSNKLFGNPVQVVELFFSVSQCVFAIIAYHYLSRDQNNPAQFCIYPIAFAFCLLCLSFIRREPWVSS
ncbi:hypothetical protein NC651_034358 [Populus alba x Populus x berolinensis]|nr:hypothetical protein NC651_034358 [Populus alba x Populus x berolinensis]